MRRARLFLLAIGAALLPAAGCEDDITEVLLIVNSDLRPFLDFETVAFSAQAGVGTPPQFTNCLSPTPIGAFPVSMAFVSQGSTSAFSVKVQLARMFSQEMVASRTITGIRFVPEELRMLSVDLKAVCKCQGTSCPNPGTNPDCDSIENPATIPFDPLVAPKAGPPAFPCPEFFSGR